MSGKLRSLARRSERRAPMEELSSGEITRDFGLLGDFKGAKHKTRQITILALEDWRAALSDLGRTDREYPWLVRRANLLVENIRLPRAKGAVLSIGAARFEVTGQTYPCKRMDEALPGLLKALSPEWRGGVTCRVIEGGELAVGDEAVIIDGGIEHIR